MAAMIEVLERRLVPAGAGRDVGTAAATDDVEDDSRWRGGGAAADMGFSDSLGRFPRARGSLRAWLGPGVPDVVNYAGPG